jgi:hypothetical protein
MAQRGRPPVMSKVEEYLWASLKDNATSRRTTVNTYYFSRARREIMAVDPALWTLFSDESMSGNIGRSKVTSHGRVPWTVITELGRFDDTAAMVEAARWVADTKPTTKEAIRVLRAVRLNRMPKATAEGLAAALISALNGYMRDNGTLDCGGVCEAMHIFRESIDEWIKENFSDNQEAPHA